MSDTAAILAVDDEAAFARAVALRLGRDGHDCRTAGTLAEARAALAGADGWLPDVVLLDVRLPDGNGLDLLGEIAGTAGDRDGAAVIAMTAFGDVDTAVAAMKGGALDYLRKPVDLDELSLVVRRTLDARALKARLDFARSREREREPADEPALIGRSPAMAAARREIAGIAALAGQGDDGAPPHVLLVGETGTGKDIAARMIHALGPHPARPFVRVDCPGLGRDNAEAELFGSGGARAEPGLIEAAEDGTLFLDEICELPMGAQGRLLSVMERRRVRRPGGGREHPVAARFVAATNRDIAALVGAGDFRADLYYRLNVLTVRLPPLRECPGDAPLLARHFAAATARRYGRPVPGLTEAAATALDSYAWPGNVRELAHLIERAVLLNRTGDIGLADLPLIAGKAAGSDTGAADGAHAGLDGMTLDGAERWLIARALERTRGNVSAAARLLGVTRMTMRYRMERYGL